MSNEEILKEITRGAVDLISRDELAKKLSSGKKLRVKFGADPTSRDLHLGHSVVLTKLRQFQDLGNTVVLIIGDFTAQVGDPSGRDSTRPVLDHETVANNSKTYTEQAFKVLDPERTEIRFNSEWLKPFFASPAAGVSDFINSAKSVTISRLLEREDFRARMKAETPISLLEILYPLLQGYDSVAVKAGHPMEAKKKLAGLITARYHGAEQALAARAHFEQVFSRKELPEDMATFRAEKAGKLSYLMVSAGLAKGMNEARRLIEQGAVRLDGEKVGEDIVFEPRNCVLQVGRRQFRKIEK